MACSNWTIEKPIPTFAIAGLDVAIAFYSRLGFEVDWRWPDADPTHAGLMHGSCSIMLSSCDPDERSDVYFIVSDVTACHAHILGTKPWEIAASTISTSTRDDCPPQRSLQPPDSPKQQPYGLKDFSVVDPWGHHLTFGQAVDS